MPKCIGHSKSVKKADLRVLHGLKKLAAAAALSW